MADNSSIAAVATQHAKAKLQAMDQQVSALDTTRELS